MSAQDTPRAFPSATIDDAFGGMSKREWFAGLAMAGFCAAPDFSQWTPENVASEAYKVADAMIAAGKRDG